VYKTGETMNDETLVREFRKGSKDAFSELVRRHSKPLTMMILRIIRDEEESKDLSQKAFMKAYTGLPRFLMASSFKTWLYRIAINLVKDHLRVCKHVKAPDEVDEIPDAEASPEHRLDQARNLEKMREAIEDLPEKQRLTLQLRTYEGMDYREIARILGGTSGGARGNFFQAVKTLRERLGTEE
jgi:RNA polymerase sigma factor (sigma-70 family)